MSTLKRTLLATILAPLMAPMFIIAWSSMFYAQWEKQELIAVFAVSSVVAYSCTLLFAIPLVSVLRKLHRLTLVTLSICGAMLGIIVMLTISRGPVQALWGGLLGLCVSATFGVIAGVEISKNRA